MRSRTGNYARTGITALVLMISATACTGNEPATETAGSNNASPSSSVSTSPAPATTPASPAAPSVSPSVSAVPTPTLEPLPSSAPPAATEAPSAAAAPTEASRIGPPVAPQPLGPEASPEDLAKARESLLDHGYSPEEAAAWPTLPVVVPDDAIDVVAGLWGRGSNLTYEAAFIPDAMLYEVTVTVRSPNGDGEAPVTAIWEVRPDGTYTWVS